MQTQYQLLYRYINETTNTAITDEAEYVETKVFYNPDHKLNFNAEQLKALDKNATSPTNTNTLFKFNFDQMSSTAVTGKEYDEYCTALNIEAETEREKIIIEQMANVNKSNNFYIYDGTTKEYHEKYVPETLGYKVANWQGIPENQMPSGPDDYTKDFVMLNGSQPGKDKAFLVCKPDKVESYNREYSEANIDKEQIVLSGEKFANNLLFDWYNPQDDSYTPLYKETEAKIEYVEDDHTVHADLGGNRIVNLDGEDYLIIDATKYTCDVRFELDHTRSDDYGHIVARFYKMFHTGALFTYRKGHYGTIFFNCGTKIPKTVTVATVDGSTLAKANDIFASASPSTDGNDCLDAYIKYATTLNGIRIGSGFSNDTDKWTNSINSSVANPTSLTVYTGWKLSELEKANMSNYILSLDVKRQNLTRYVIPEHYEPANAAPYIVKDNYKKIPLSPWILHSVHNSLESGLEKARKLVSMIGLENVKLIKTVPFDQFIKIK